MAARSTALALWSEPRDPRSSTKKPWRAARGRAHARRRALVHDRRAHRPVAERQVHRPRRRDRRARALGRRSIADDGAPRSRLLDADIADYLRNRDVFVQDLAGGCRPALSAAGARRHRAGVAQPVRARTCCSVGAIRRGRSRRISHRRGAGVPGDSGPPRHELRDRDCREHGGAAASSSAARRTPARSRSPSSRSSTTCCRSGTCCRCTARRTSAPTATWRCSSACRAPARRRSRAIRRGG